MRESRILKKERIVRILSLQALRAVGAIAVVLYHAGTLGAGINLRVGATGVDLFFIISGVVMYLSVNDQTSMPSFLWARFTRVVPLYWIGTIGAVGVYIAKSGHFPPILDIAKSAFFLPSEHFGDFPILYPGWSLNYETFFYALIAVLLMFGSSAMSLAATTTLALGTLHESVQIPYAEYYCQPVMIEFAAGILIGMAIRARLTPSRGISTILICVGIVLLVLHSPDSKINAAVGWGVPWAMILIGSIALDSSRLVRSKITQLLGAASYSIYLAHPFVIWGIEALTRDRNNLVFASAAALSILSGLIAHLVIEKPLLSGLRKFQPFKKLNVPAGKSAL
ncbi:acyltransferase family protein [Burkholderia cepacia]|uniref:acyltransferase family protein n=1 Tax=Burkholderia cepacia TaxID=292 RepID=UPI0018C5C0F5|nr:acyltransferase [Burkholderia cepacia]